MSAVKVKADGLVIPPRDYDGSLEEKAQEAIYFPMKLTGLQSAPFDVNLYVFYGAWLNDRLNGFGYEHQKFLRRWRDYDSSKCKANAGKNRSNPKKDPYLVSFASKIPTLTKYFEKHHADERFYLTNIQARGLKPKKVRDWNNDLWLFPFYTDKSFVPFDAREGGVADFLRRYTCGSKSKRHYNL